jgi:MarR family transcriptional regulator for hemolysin
MTCKNPEDNLYWQLIDMLVRSKRKLEPTFEKHGITGFQAYVLALLSEENGKPMSFLSHTLQCDASNTTILIDRLEGLGLIERRTSPEDRRVKLLYLTPKGKKIHEQLKQVMQELQQKALQRTGFDKKTISQALATVEKFI